MSEEQTTHIEQPVSDEDTKIGLPFKVVLYNDDWHTFDEVIVQLIKAVHCTFDEARSYAFEVHVKGKAIVFSGEMMKCLKVTSILEQIGLHTEIVSEE